MTTAPKTPTKNRMQPIVAWRAMQELLKDKEDTAQVFRITQALGGGELPKNFKRFKETQAGEAILAEKRSLLKTLADRETLATLPEGSLGRAYLDFVQTEDISAEGLIAASEEGGRQTLQDDGEILYSERTRDMHDLWHVVTGYGRDGLGELSLLAFSYAQVRNLGIGFIVLMALRKSSQENPGAGISKSVREGYRLGKQAAWLPAADWEALLERPLEDVREELKCARQTVYPKVLQRLIDTGSTYYSENLTSAAASN